MASTNYQVLKATSEEAKLPEKTLSKQPLMVYPTDQQLEQDTATSHKLNYAVLSEPQSLPPVYYKEVKPKANPRFLIFSVILSVICGVQFCLPTFLCLTPAVILGIVGYSLSDLPQHKITAKILHRVSLYCSIASIAWYILAVIAIAVTLGVNVAFGGFDNIYTDYVFNDYDYGDPACWESCTNATGCLTVCP